MKYPPMYHLPGFWDDENWNDICWSEYRKRRKGFFNWFSNWKDQYFHRWMGVFLERWEWEERETEQWPSKTGSYDPCEDHWNWLVGSGRLEEAALLKKEAQRRRPEFLK